MRSLLRPVAELLLPLQCASCGTAGAEGLCHHCRRESAALVLGGLGRDELGDGVLALGAFAYDGVIRTAIHNVKLGGQHGAAPGLGRLMWTVVGTPPAGNRAVLTTWVPSTRRRERERGSDLPRLLAGPGARRLLRRVRERPDQTTLDAAARRRSPAGSFAALGRMPPRVILVDDVRTTGATALAAATALQAAGARRVLVVTLAVAGPPGGRRAQGPDPGKRSDHGSGRGRWW